MMRGDLASMRYRELQVLCKSKGLKASGKKTDLLERLRGFDEDAEYATKRRGAVRRRSPRLSVYSATRDAVRRWRFSDLIRRDSFSNEEAYQREVDEYEEEMRAAIVIQKYWRGQRGRALFGKWRFRSDQINCKRAKLFHTSFLRTFGLSALAVLIPSICFALEIFDRKTFERAMPPETIPAFCTGSFVVSCALVRYPNVLTPLLGPGMTAAPLLASAVALVVTTTYVVSTFVISYVATDTLHMPVTSASVFACTSAGTIVGAVWRWKTLCSWTYQHMPWTSVALDERTAMEEYETGDVVLHSGDDALSRVIKFFTGSRACHVGVIVKNPSRAVRRSYGLDTKVQTTRRRSTRSKRKRQRAKEMKGVYVLETVFGRPGHALEMMRLVDWVNQYRHEDGDDYAVFVRHASVLFLRGDRRDRSADEIALGMKTSEYEPNFHAIVMSTLRLQAVSSMRHIYCSELVAAVLQQIGILSHAIGQSDVLPGDFEPLGGDGGVPLDTRYMRQDASLGPLLRIRLTDEIVRARSRPYTSESRKNEHTDSFHSLKYIYHFLFTSRDVVDH